MRIRGLAVVILALVLCTPVLAQGKPAKLRISHASPVTAVGSGFKGGEFVRVTLSIGAVKKTRGAVATTTGGFKVVWRGMSIDGCDWRVSAVGRGGSHAAVHGNPAVCQTLPPLD
jgi:hypothetical protein